MKTAVINFKVDPKIKALAQARAKKMGVSLSTILHAQLYNFAEGRSIEFPAEHMTPQMEKIAQEAIRDIKNGDISPGFDNADELMKYLRSHHDD